MSELPHMALWGQNLRSLSRQIIMSLGLLVQWLLVLQSLSRARLFATPRSVACQAPLSVTCYLALNFRPNLTLVSASYLDLRLELRYYPYCKHSIQLYNCSSLLIIFPPSSHGPCSPGKIQFKVEIIAWQNWFHWTQAFSILWESSNNLDNCASESILKYFINPQIKTIF